MIVTPTRRLAPHVPSLWTVFSIVVAVMMPSVLTSYPSPCSAEPLFSSAYSPLRGARRSPTVVMGDLNADGDVDIVTASEPDSVVALLGNGEGEFPSRISSAIDISPRSMSLGDLNGDGRPDLAIADYYQSVYLFLGVGDGSFVPGIVVYTSPGPRSVALADLDEDGALDLIVANDGGSYGSDSGFVSVRLGVGNGLFGPAMDLSAGPSPSAVAVADFNGDTHLDLAVASRDLVTVLYGVGNGSFSTPSNYDVPSADASLVAADLDLNGRPDIVVTVPGFNRVAVLLADNGGTFGVPSSFAAGGLPNGIAVGDLNGDGRPDLAVSGEGFTTTPGLAVLLGIGAGAFGPPSFPIWGWDGHSIAMRDLNGDGRLDLIVGAPRLEVLFGNGDGTFGKLIVADAGPSPLAVTAGDLNGDGSPDLAFVNIGDGLSDGGVAVLLGDGLGGLGARANYPTGSNPWSVATGDLNGDGRLDLAVANRGGDFFSSDTGSVSVLIGSGDGAFALPLELAGRRNPTSIVIADLNGDGPLDLAVANLNSDLVSVFLGEGNGTFAARIDSPAGVRPYSLASGDFDADGNMDLAVAGRNGSMTVLAGDGAGGFTIGPVLDVASVGGVISAADVNQDHRLDLVMAWGSAFLPGYGGFAVMLGAKSGFSAPASVNLGGLPNGLTLADFDGDAKLDLATASELAVDVFLGNGDGTLGLEAEYGVAGVARSITVADLNHDGRLDLALGTDGDRASVMLNVHGISTATQLALVRADATSDFVRLEWYDGSAGSTFSAEVYRCTDRQTWQWSSTPTLDRGRIVFEDHAPIPGERHGYRLVATGGVERVLQETWVDVPAVARLALLAPTPNPSVGAMTITFQLGSHDPATLEAWDVTGRRVLSREVGGLGPGVHAVRLGGEPTFGPGLYWVRVTQGSATRAVRACLIR